MITDASGAKVGWDYQVGTFIGEFGGVRVGKFGGDVRTIVDLEARLGVSLSQDTKVCLMELYSDNPPKTERVFVSKLQFMDLFREDDLVKIYDAAKVSSAVQIELDRVTRAPNDEIELTDVRTMKGLQNMEAAGLIRAGDADRIKKGIPWQ